MKLNILALCFGIVSAAHVKYLDALAELGMVKVENHPQNYRIPTKEEGAQVARTLVKRESMMNVNTIGQSETEKGLPKSTVEYYVDCDGDGNPYWLVVDDGSPFRDISNGSPFTASIRVGDHPLTDYVDPNYPGGIPQSPMGSPRVNLRGMLEEVPQDPETSLKLSQCFLERHPDARWWLPSNPLLPHKTHWTRIVVSDVYMVGGFGDSAYIGSIDGETYHRASILE